MLILVDDMEGATQQAFLFCPCRLWQDVSIVHLKPLIFREIFCHSLDVPISLMDDMHGSLSSSLMGTLSYHFARLEWPSVRVSGSFELFVVITYGPYVPSLLPE